MLIDTLAKGMRKTIIAGNWKMNKTPSEAKALLDEIAPLVADAPCEVVACVPYVDLATAVEATKDTNIKIGAENCHWAESGAFTGEISTAMLKEIGVEYVVIGHSERRQYFGETDATVNLRTKAALEAGLKVILCVGELKEEREANATESVIKRQVVEGLAGISAEQMANVVIAYEPVWAIGTGLTATPEQAEDACAVIRATIAELYGNEVAEATTIQYGGSMNDANAADLLAKPNIDGGLIGGASLVAKKFTAIVDAAQ